MTADLLGIRLSGGELEKTTVSFTSLHAVIGGREKLGFVERMVALFPAATLLPAEKRVLQSSLILRPPQFLFFNLYSVVMHKSVRSFVSVYYTEHKLKNKKQGSPGNEADEKPSREGAWNNNTQKI